MQLFVFVRRSGRLAVLYEKGRLTALFISQCVQSIGIQFGKILGQADLMKIINVKLYMIIVKGKGKSRVKAALNGR